MTAALKLPPRRMTVAEFIVWDAPDDRRWQLRDGVPEMMAPAADRHGTIQAEMAYLLIDHLRRRDSPCRVVTEPGIIPRVRAHDNFRIPDLGVTCTPATDSVEVPDPVVMIEILSRSNRAQTWANVWSFTTIPSVQDIVVLQRDRIAADLLRRQPDGSWPAEPERIGANDELRLDSIGFAVPLRDAYRAAGLK